MSNEQQSSERSAAGSKLFEQLTRAVMCAAVLGDPLPAKFFGTREHVAIAEAAIVASSELIRELRSSEATVNTVVVKLNAKRNAAAKFAKAFGFSFPV